MTTTDPQPSPQTSAARVSVVVPSFNHAQFVEDTLHSIIKQTLAPAELIVIDDGSTDNSTSIIERLLAECPFPSKLIARENRGLCATLNEGLDQSRGEYFAYLGSDDLWLPDFLKARTELLSSRPKALLAYGHSFFIDEENRIVDCTSHWANYADGDACQMLLQTIAPMSPTVLYRREVLLRHRWNEAARLEDYEMYLRLCPEGEFAFDERVLSAWRRHAANTSWNQVMLLEEQLRAQRANAATLGLSQDELQKLQTVTKFRRAEDFIRIGDKRHAFKLMRDNISGIRSASELARMLLRLSIPSGLMDWRNKRKARRTQERYGAIEN
jgi:alpha-1,3-rhamnosyltransferase